MLGNIALPRKVLDTTGLLVFYLETNRFSIVGIACWNPAFDVTPASLIAGIITEKGVFRPHELLEKFGNNT